MVPIAPGGTTGSAPSLMNWSRIWLSDMPEAFMLYILTLAALHTGQGCGGIWQDISSLQPQEHFSLPAIAFISWLSHSEAVCPRPATARTVTRILAFHFCIFTTIHSLRPWLGGCYRAARVSKRFSLPPSHVSPQSPLLPFSDTPGGSYWAPGRSACRTAPPNSPSRSNPPAETRKTPPRPDCRHPRSRRSLHTGLRSAGGEWRLPRSADWRRCRTAAPA